MDTPNSGSAAAPSEGSTPASISAGTSPNRDEAHDPVGSSGNPAPLDLGHLGDDGDDASDVSMSSETDDSEDDVEGGSLQIITQQNVLQNFPMVDAPTDQSKKRKLSSDMANVSNERSGDLMTTQNSKRIKLDLPPDLVLHSYRTADGHLPVDRSLLPAEVWHHVFSFTPPKALGHLLQVNKLFRAYLEYSASASTSLLASLSRSSAPLRQPEAIWQAARRLFRPGMPTPLDGSTELDMWRLACNTACQFCGRKEQRSPRNSIDQWRSGPGENGVRPVWAFSSRTCGSCLKTKTMKEIDLLLSSSVPSPLMAALPFVFLTSEFHIVSPSTLQHGQPPADVQIGKYFYKPQVEDIKMEFFRVKAMGSGTAEEWLKGLDNRGRERKSDAARWERWESAGGVQRMQVSESAELNAVITKSTVTDTAAPLEQLSSPLPALPTGLSRIPVVMNDFGQPSQMPFHSLQTIQVPYAVGNTPPRFDSPVQNGFNPYQQRSFQLGRQERTKEEVAELKAARKREIERRSMLLDPPLLPGVLAHMGSFQAAIQIIKPFDDDAWELLKPRLLSQRSEAEQRENDRIALLAMQERLDERQNQLIHANDGKEVVDRDWEDAQTPIRSRIGAYADEVIRDGWNWGEKVTKDNSPTFAAEVLLYVRKRFYAEIAKDDAAARAAGQQPKIDPQNGPFTQKLILENMKWVFDMRIKPHTEQYRKELFLCNGCENNFKFYGFEGVIQHYAAKHTSSLSVGSIVVHWRAEWPEHPPFNPEPGNANGNNGSYNATALGASYTTGAPNLPLAFGRGGFPAVSAPLAAAAQVPHSAAYQEISIDYYSHPQQNEKYPAPKPLPLVPPTTFPGAVQTFPTPQHQALDVNGYHGYPGYAQQTPDGHVAGSSSINYDAPHLGHAFTAPAVVQPGRNQYAGLHGTHDVNPSVSVHSAGLYNPQPTGIRHTEAYKNQLQDVARIAREIWNGTSGIKDLPGSVRVYVILHHIVQRSRVKYPDDPTLAMLIDGLSNNKDMRPVRNVNGLVCRACALEKANENLNPYAMSSRGAGNVEKKSFSLPQLFNHFQTTHNGITQAVTWDGEGSPPEWDWTKDMIELPEKAKISSLAAASGTDNHKIKLIMEALPDAFKRSPTPANQSLVHEPLNDFVEGPPDQSHLAPSRDHHDKFYSLTYDRSADEPEMENYGEFSGGAREVPDRIDSAGASSERRRFEDRSTTHLNRTPITYVDRRARTPGTNTRQPGEYWQQEIADESYFYSDNADPYFPSTDTQYRRRPPRPSNLPPLDDQSRIERQHAAEPSMPRVTQSGGRPNGKDSVYRDVNSSVDHYDNDPTYRHEPVPLRVTSRLVSGQHPLPLENMDDGSEDGEVRAQPSPRHATRPVSAEAHSAADRFFDDFERSQHLGAYVTTGDEAKHRTDDNLNANWRTEREDNSRRIYMPSAPHHQARHPVIDQGYNVTSEHRHNSYDRPLPPSTVRMLPEQSQTQRHVIAYDYDDRPSPHFREQHHVQSYSSEVGDHHYDGNAMHGDDRSGVQIMHQQPPRLARYENVRLENDARSRSPIYVSVASQPPQYRERSPGARYVQQQPSYRALSPQALDDSVYERVPRPEYYRVYADEPRPRQPQYESQFEYVKMRDAQGDYVIRRSVRREEPAYAAYAEEQLPRQAIYETRAPVSRSDPAYYEEYDPRNPAPPPQTTVRQVRYQ